MWIGVVGILALTGLSQGAWAKEGGPDLKFDPNQTSGAESQPAKSDYVYGDKPLAKFGNDNTYVKLGGYGSMRFEYDSGRDLNDTFTLRRLVLSVDAKIASRFRIGTELEFERFRKVELQSTSTFQPGGGVTLSQNIEGTHQSEISLEQAWFEVEFKKWLRFKGGAVLVPLGRFNINHDDNQWNLPRRSLIDRGIPVLPVEAAWDELGLGFTGDADIGKQTRLGYQVFVINGAILNPTFSTSIQTRPGNTTLIAQDAELGMSNGPFGSDLKNAKTVTGRLMYSPALGHEFGFSGYWGRYTPDSLPGENLTAFGFDTLQTFKNFDLEAEYLFVHYGGLRNVINAFAASVGDQESSGENPTNPPGVETQISFQSDGLASTKQGYWLEMRYHWRPRCFTDGWLGKHFSDPQLIPVLRWEQAFIQGRIVDAAFNNGVVSTFTTENRFVDRLTAGLAFRLNPLAVFQLAYEYTWTNHGKSLGEVSDFLPTTSSKNHSVMLGAAFGF
jgi:hypothetical protein